MITDQHCSSPALLYTSAHKRFTGTGTGAGMPCCNAAHTKRRPLQTPLTTYVPRCSLIICMDEPYACQLHTLPGGQHLQWESSKQHGPVQSLLPTPHLLQLRSRVAPFWSRFSASELDSPDRNRLENTLARRQPRHARPRALPKFAKRQGAAQQHHDQPAAGAAHGVKACRRRRSRCARCKSARPAGQYESGSSPSSCIGRGHSGRAGTAVRR